MSDLTDSDITKPTLRKLESNESAWIKTGRLAINLVTNILMCVTVFVCLLYACGSKNITAFQVHIILCVLGYQLFMCQGTLVVSAYSWSMYMSRWNRKRLHVVFQLLGFVLVVVGSSVIMCEEQHHFKSKHGTLGIIALIISAASVLNGALFNYAYKLTQSCVLVVKFIHYLSGVFTLFLSAAALSTGFEEFPFRIWLNNDDALAGLIFVIWLFTLLVSLDFWLLLGQRLRSLA